MPSLEPFDRNEEAQDALSLCGDNIHALAVPALRIHEETLLWLKEYAEASVRQWPAMGDALEEVEALPPLPSPLRRSADVSASTCEIPGLSAGLSALSIATRRALCIAYTRFFHCACSTHAEHRMYAGAPWKDEKAGEVCAYVRTPLCDRAFHCATRFFKSPTVYYATTFEEVCAEVHGERADFALLPLMDGEGEPVRTTEMLIEKYELCINACIRLGGNVGEGMVYALLSRCRFALGSEAQGGESLAISYHPSGEEGAADLLVAAAAFGCEMQHASFSTTTYGRMRCRATFIGAGTELLLLWLLQSEYTFTVVGIYRTVNEE